MKRISSLFIFVLILIFYTSCVAQKWQAYLDSGLIYAKKDTKKALDFILLSNKNLPVDSVGTLSHAKIVNNLGNLYSDMGRYEKAESFYIEAKNIRKRILGKEHSDYASSLNNLAAYYSDMGQYEKAEPFYIEAKNIQEKVLGKKHPDYASSLSMLGNLYSDMGQYEKAEPLYIEAKNIYEQKFGKAHPEYASSLNNLAVLYSDMGQYEKAESFYIEAKNIREKALGKEDPDYASSQYNLALLYYDMGQYDKAEPLYIEAKNIREKALGKGHPDYAQSCNNLALLYRRIGQYEKAEPLYIEAKNIQEKALGKAHPDYAIILNGLAVLYSDKGQYEKSEPLLIEAKNIREKALGKAHPKYTQSCINLAELYWVTNNPIKADSLYKEAFIIKYHQVQKNLQFISEKEMAGFIENIIGGNDFYNSFYYKSYSHTAAGEPYTISFLSRNLILYSSQQIKKLINSSNDKIALVDYEKWSALKKQLAAFYSSGKNVPYVKTLEDSADVLEKNLKRVSSGFKKIQEDKTWQDIQKTLKENETAIEFVEFHYNTGKRWTDSTYYIALMLKKDMPEPLLVPLFEKKQLDSLLLRTGNKNTTANVKALYYSRGAGIETKTAISQSLYKLIWKPLEKELKGINTVYYAPAGLLHRIAFAALPVNNKQVLSDQYKLIQLATTASVTEQVVSFVNASDNIQLFGGIKYDTDSSALKQAANIYTLNKANIAVRSLPNNLERSGTFNYLPGTQAEIETIGKLAKVAKNHVSVLSGDSASEESFKALEGKASPSVIHIATHGFFFPDPKQDKKNPDIFETSGKVFRQSDNPLFRSGLLFAGANYAWSGKQIQGIEDGILTAYEVSNMYLPNTKLVVLSACETALGDIQGSEGVYGLQRAFKMAGVENLVMSLWKVPDQETSEFMQIFYKNMFERQSISDAFYLAQTTMKNKYREEPFKWAAWVLVR